MGITQAVDTISKIMPNAHGCLVPGVGHGWNVEAPDLSNALEHAWISGTPLPAEMLPAHPGSV